MISRVVVLPSPPLLVPELTVAPTPDVQRLREACLRAVSSLTDYPAELAGLGTDQSAPKVLPPWTRGTFAGFGVDVPVSLGHVQQASASRDERAASASNSFGEAECDPDLPLPALIAGWFRQQVGHEALRMHLVAPDTDPADAIGAGRELAAGADEQALLVVTDGTNRRNEQSPYPPDPRAFEFDEGLRCALAELDREWLRQIDCDLAVELGVTGRSALQASVGAVDASGGEWRARLEHASTPFGVTYHVAVWDRCGNS